MNSTKKVKVFASIVVLVAAVFAQTVPAVLAQEQVLIAVNGTLMRGLELEPNLVNLGAAFVREDRTEPAYRLYSVNDIHPAMVRLPANATNCRNMERSSRWCCYVVIKRAARPFNRED